MEQNSYIDEKIIRLQQIYQMKENEPDILKDDIVICGKKIEFTDRMLFDGKVSVLVPDCFILMPEEIAKIRYNSLYRPPVILTGADYSENFCFHLLAKESVDLAVEIKKMEESTLRHTPDTVVYDSGSIDTAQIECRWFEYKNFTVNDETYNLQFLAYQKPYLLAGTFNCRMIYFDEWKTPVLQSLSHIAISKSSGDMSRGK